MIVTKGIRGLRTSHSIWWIYLPSEEDRDKYIENCFRTSTVSIINANGEVKHKVPIGKVTIQFIDFPIEDEQSLGSPVLCANIVGHNQLFVIDAYYHENDFNLIEENQLRLIKTSNDNLAELVLKGRSGEVFINVEGEEENEGLIKINATNKTKTAKMVFEVNGDIEIFDRNIKINSSESFNIKIFDAEENESVIQYVIGEGFLYQDEFDNLVKITDGDVQIKSNSIRFGEGEEPLVLGNRLVELLNDLIVEISKSTTNAGPLLNAIQIANFSNRLSEILSETSHTD